VIEDVKYGSGNKVLHKVVGGRMGVFAGNGGDLRIGLPTQSQQGGSKLQHTPLRLSACIEAPTKAIGSIIAKHAVVRQLIHHQWPYLLQIGAAAGQQNCSVSRYAKNSWLQVTSGDDAN
jgi:uncharacterized protein YbcC (UPF0753/DUF2309 family)